MSSNLIKNITEFALYLIKGYVSEGDVVVDGHIRPQGIVLEQEADLALVGRNVDAHGAVENHLVPDRDTAAGGRFQTGNHAQRGRLAAAGRAEQRHEGVVPDDEVQVLHGVEFAPALGDML